VQSAFKSIAEAFLEERERWLLWLPVFMGLGISLYFMGATEPALWPALAIAGVLVPVAILLRHNLFMPLVLAALMMALGFGAARIETMLMTQPMLDAPMEAAMAKGRVMAISRLPDGYRLNLEDVSVEGLAPEKTPRNIYVKFRYQEKLPRLGSVVDVKATLYPLSGPVEPGAFNFRRFAFYQGYGATGFALGYWKYAEKYEERSTPKFLQRVALFFEQTRNNIRERMLTRDDGRDMAVAVAMITGDQTAIPKGTLQAMRVSGVSHILSVSGLHIAMVAGVVFFALRALMALWPWLALHYPIKKIAAVFALLSAVIYTLICAAPVPAVRSMLMTGLVLIAVMVDRRALSMRLISFAAVACLFFAPSALLDVSFQLSFFAVMALVAAYEDKENALLKRFKDQSWLGKILFYIVGSILTSIIASVATMPLILYYFQQVNWYGVLTNLIAVPLSSFIIMPAALVSVLLMPFHWEQPALWVMKEGVAAMIKVAEWVSLLPGAVTYHPAMGFGFLLAALFGGLWLCLWQRHWRYLGLVPLLIGTFGFLLTPRPDVLVAQDGITVAVRHTDGNLIVRAKSMDDFTAKAWKQRDGKQGEDAPASYNWFDVITAPGAQKTLGPLGCDGSDCEYVNRSILVEFPMTDSAMKSMCTEGSLVIGVTANCSNKTTLNYARAKAEGSHALYFNKGGIVIRSARSANSQRPWD
jgi:competence protein ComEC